MKMDRKTKGIICILGAAFCFACMNLFVKLAGDIPFMQKSFFRNVIAAIVAGYIVLNNRKVIRKPDTKSLGLLFVRAGFGTMGLLCNFYAIDHLNISDASMLNKLSPFFAIIFSLIFLHERANFVQSISVVMAFLGSLLIIKPSFSPEVIPALIGVLGGLGAGMAYTAVRALGERGVKGPFIVFFFSIFSTLVTIPVLIFDYTPMNWWQWISLILAGLSATGGQFCITAAYTFAPAKEISVYDYSQIIFAALLGLIFLGEVPDLLSICGYVIIFVVAVSMWKYNMRNK